jgi:CHAT domain-containing protein
MIVLGLLLGSGSLPTRSLSAQTAASTKARAPDAAAAVVARAGQLRKAKQFATAQVLLEARLKILLTPLQQRALREALADVHFDHAQSLRAAHRFEDAIRFFQAAYEIDLVLRPNEAAADLRNIGFSYAALSRHSDALRFYELALQLQRQLKDAAGQAISQDNIGQIYYVLGRYDEALRRFELALPLRRAAKDVRGEAITLNNIAVNLSALGRQEEALRFFEMTLPLHRRARDTRSEASTFSNIGVANLALGRYGDGLKYLLLALPLMRQSGDRAGVALVLNNIGTTYSNLSRHEEALVYLQQALEMQRTTRDLKGQVLTLGNIGSANEGLGRIDQAVRHYALALPLARSIGDRRAQGVLLVKMGGLLTSQGGAREALKYAEQGLAIRREVGDREGEGVALNVIGRALAVLERPQEARRTYSQALSVQREVGDRRTQSVALSSLMALWRQEQPRLAIFYGKQAVNAIQEMRLNIGALERKSQRAFLQTNEAVYRHLADLLISQDRLPEAQQVLGLLKEEEFFQFVRRDAAQADTLNGRATLSPGEAQAQQQMDEAAAQVTRSGARRGQLLALATRTPEQEAELEAAETNLEKANRAFESFLANLEKQFAQTSQAGRVEQIQDAQALQETLRDLGHGAVALYTLVGEDKVRVMLVTPDARAASEHEIKREDLNRKIAALRRVLQSPARDPRPLAQEMHKILLGPLQKALDAAGAKTLMWSLDGPLRYIPVAALHDGDKYLVERYSNTIFTPASTSNLKDEPGDKWRALGLGVTREKPGFSALPSVEAELRGIIANEGAPAAASALGILPGTIALDDGFTEAAMKGALRKRPALVHIASHFQFQPGDETTSFLLLGDGKHLSLDQIKNISFGGVKLLTLSACDTASGGTSADGTEVEGFAVLAQRQGAQAVLASLWPVADSSTQQLMHAFYREREKLAGTPKSHALRQAQLSLLGEKAPAAARPNPAPIEERGARGLQPKFEADPEAPFAHPYFWAPFVLIGNWK